MRTFIPFLLFFCVGFISTAHAEPSPPVVLCEGPLIEGCLQEFSKAVKGVGTPILPVILAGARLNSAVQKCSLSQRRCDRFCNTVDTIARCKKSVSSEANEARKVAQKMHLGLMSAAQVMDLYGVWDVVCAENQTAGPGNKCYTNNTAPATKAQ